MAVRAALELKPGEYVNPGMGLPTVVLDSCARRPAGQVPGGMVKGMGGAMNLISGAGHVIVLMHRLTKKGDPTSLPECILPLAGCAAVSLS